MNIITKNLIGYAYSAVGNETFSSYNPKDQSDTPWVFKNATLEELKKATALAETAFNPYKSMSVARRAAFLRAIAKEILALGDSLTTVYTTETGLPKGRAEGERARTIGQLEAFANAIENGQYLQPIIDQGDANRTPIPKVDLRKINEPIGPIAVFGASNFPLAYSTAGGDTASALATGCPVVVKAHPMHAATNALVAQAILKAAQDTKMPEGVFSCLYSNNYEVGTQLVQDPMIKGVGFTGSIAGGTALYKLAQTRATPIPVFAEMGSVNPVVVLPEALNENSVNWAKAYAGSIALGSGQFCTNPGLLFGVASPELDTFIDQLSKAFNQLDPHDMLHPNIHTAYEKGKAEFDVIATKIGTTASPSSPKEGLGHGVIYKVNASTFNANPRLHQEVFGPLSLVVECKNVDELTTLIKGLEGQLTGTILGSETALETNENLVITLRSRVGRLIFNGVPTGVEVCAAMQHGGPFPASTDERFTAVGVKAMDRWLRPVSYQNWPDKLLPKALQNNNPLGLTRLINGNLTKD